VSNQYFITNEAELKAAAEQFRSEYPELARKCNGRMEKAIDLAMSGHVESWGADGFAVGSQTSATVYGVSLVGEVTEHTCSCKDTWIGYCKHRLAAWLVRTLAQATEPMTAVEILAEMPSARQATPQRKRKSEAQLMAELGF